MASAQERLTTLQQERLGKARQIEERVEAKEIELGRGQFNPARDALILQLSDQISKLDRQIDIARGVAEEVGVRDIPEAEQQRVISEREAQTERLIRERTRISREQELRAREPELKETVTITKLPPKKIGREEIGRRRELLEQERIRQEKIRTGEIQLGGVFITPEEARVSGIKIEEAEDEVIPKPELRFVTREGERIDISRGVDIKGEPIIPEALFVPITQPEGIGISEVISGKAKVVSRKIREARLKLAGVPVTEENIKRLRQLETQFREDVTPLLTLGVLGLSGVPLRIVRTISPIIKRVSFAGTIKRTGDISEIRVITKAKEKTVSDLLAIPKIRETFSVSKVIVGEKGERAISLGKGVRFEIKKVTELPSTIPKLKLEKVEPFVSVGVGEKLGKALQVKDLGIIKAKREIGTAGLIRTQTLTRGELERDVSLFVSRRGLIPDTIRVIGGRPTLRVKRISGDLSLILRKPKIRGTLFEIMPETKEGIKFLQPITKKKTPFKLTFKEQEVLAGLVTPKITPLTIPKTPKTPLTPILKVEGITPVEKIEALTIQVPKVKVTTIQKEKIVTIPTTKLRFAPTERERIVSVQVPKLRFAPAERERIVSVQVPTFKITPVEREKIITIPVSIPKLKIPTRPPTTIFKILPIPKPRPKGFPLFKFKKPRQTRRIQRGLFGVEVRRRGKFRPVGTGLSLGEALGLGRQRVKTTLAATFRITGRDTKGIRTPFGFRRGKEPRTFIEKRKFRLSTFPEVKEIQVAKRRKKKKK
jgi:hypothetical protein|tara:strand:- start:6494 stop:8797 length:2304 start_codon:yes stop_codon:yes gene_type:complete